MGNERVEFEQAADGLFRGALQAHQDPKLVAELRAAGLELTRNLAPAYPAADFYRWVGIVARHQFPFLSEAEGCREIGRIAVRRGLQSTLLGGAVLQAMKLLGIRRSLHKIGWSFKNGNNYIQAKVVEHTPTSLEIELGPLVGPPSYFQGVLEEGPRLMGAKEVRVVQVRTEGECVVWRVDWVEG